MVSTLFLFQLVSLIGYLTLVMMLLVCPYEGQEFRNYYRVQRLFIVSMLVLAAQYGIQMVFGFRAQDPMLGAAVNMIILPFVSQFYTMAVFRMLRVDRSCRRIWVAITTITSLNAAVMIPAAVFAKGVLLRWMVCGSLAFYMLANMGFFIQLILDYRRFRRNIQLDYASPMEKKTEWIQFYLFARLFMCLAIPCVAISDGAAMVFSICSYICFAYFEVKLIYYGYYIKAVEDVEKVVANEEQEEENKETEIIPTQELQNIEHLLSIWVKKESYCKSDVTLSSLAQNLAIKRSTLTAYLTAVEHKSFREWINNLRLNKAKELILQDPPYCNEAIAEACGFSSRSYFQTAFRMQEGMTPGEWRVKNI